MLTAPELPLPARVLNRSHRVASRFGVLRLRLREEDLLVRARKTTGLTNFGGDSFRDGLRVLIDALENEANLTCREPVGLGQVGQARQRVGNTVDHADSGEEQRGA